jgi:adenylate cyclase
VTDDLGPGGDARLTAVELAALAATTVERVAILTEHGVLRPVDPDAYARGDVHRVRLLAAFESGGVPFEALVAAAASGTIDFEGYHELHRDPGPPSARPYAEFRAAVDPEGDTLAALFAATGLAEADPASRLTVDEEVLLEGWLGLLAALDDRSLAVRVVRLYAESARRTADAAMDVYMEAASRLGPDPAAIDPADYARLLEPWAHVARAIPSMAEWLTERHLRRAIDAFSVDTTERLLEAGGFVPARVVAPPAIAFIDLTGFTRTTQELGDEAAAGLSLRLGDLARTQVEAHGGRLIKLLGDGALLHLPDAAAAVETAVALLAALPGAGLPSGHAGVHHGPIIEREGDVFGRTVNLAARIADEATDGAVYVTVDVVTALDGSRFDFESVGAAELQGVGPVALYRVRA